MDGRSHDYNKTGRTKRRTVCPTSARVRSLVQIAGYLQSGMPETVSDDRSGVTLNIVDQQLRPLACGPFLEHLPELFGGPFEELAVRPVENDAVSADKIELVNFAVLVSLNDSLGILL